MSFSHFVHIVESLFPKGVVEKYRKLKWQIRDKKRQSCYSKKVNELRKANRPINVLFFALDSNTWKYDSVFQAMQKDPVFSPLVLAVPQVNKGKEFMLYQLKHGCEYYESKGYPTVCSYNEETDLFVDAFSLHPDIIFFSNPYDGLVDDRYNIRYYEQNCLTCYVNYGFCSVPEQWSCASYFHQRVWRYYVECVDNLEQVKRYYTGNNCVITGYPTSDLFMSVKETGKDWKIQDNIHKRIIWAPHHTIEGQTGMIQFSTFLLYYDFMFQIADEFKDSVQFVFKPHPLLKPALYNHPGWGKKKTDDYYKRWAEGENTSFVNGDYADLFKSSDAMIHDCGSFIIEYLYVQKPVMILGNFDRLSQSNKVGREAYACHYEGKTQADIRSFIEKVLLKGDDVLFAKRKSFFDAVLSPPNGLSVSDNIITDLKKSIGITR